MEHIILVSPCDDFDIIDEIVRIGGDFMATLHAYFDNDNEAVLS